MANRQTRPSGQEIFFPDNELIVSKTDVKGKITYTNAIFEKISGYKRNELIGQLHNIIRHPDMPRCVFKLLWDSLTDRKEIFAYVLNMAKNGDHYWVLVHLVPTYDLDHNVNGYHSTRRSPKKQTIEQIIPFYNKLLEIEKSHNMPSKGLQASVEYMTNFLKKNNVTYAEHIFSLMNAA